jgi:hypothetical protein
MQVLKTLATVLAATASLTIASVNAEDGETVAITIFNYPSGMSVCINEADCFPVREVNSTDQALASPRFVCSGTTPGHCLMEDTSESARLATSFEEEKKKVREHGGQMKSAGCIWFLGTRYCHVGY